MEKEVRYLPTPTEAAELEERAEGEMVAAGIGIVYDEWQEIFPGMKERINKGAVVKTAEVKSYFNHDPSMVLATTKSDPPLKLRNSDRGMTYKAPIPPTSYGKDLIINLERGNVSGSSFAFSVPSDGHTVWEEDGVLYREIKNLTLYEIGPVTDPAYISTSANLRSAEDVYKEVSDKLASERQEAKDAEQQEKQEEERRTKLEQEFRYRTRQLEMLEKEIR